MLPNIIEGLTPQSRRGLARNLFAGFYERGISANQALSELRAAGIGYKRQDFLDDFRSDKSGYERAASVRYINEGAIPNEKRLQPEDHGVKDKYSFVYRVTGRDEDTGKKDERYFFYHTNTLEKRGEMEEKAASWYGDQAERYGLTMEDITMVEGYINKVWAGNVPG